MAAFMYAWEYRVRPDATARFREIYGPEGEWVRLFRRGSGHLETRLYRDLSVPGRYVTVDRWESEQAYRTFRRDFEADFETLDTECETLTAEERPLGEFEEQDRPRLVAPYDG